MTQRAFSKPFSSTSGKACREESAHFTGKGSSTSAAPSSSAGAASGPASSSAPPSSSGASGALDGASGGDRLGAAATASTADPGIDDSLVGDIWRRHAFEFFRVVSQEARISEDADREKVFSIGPCAPGHERPDFAWNSLLEYTNPAPAHDAKGIGGVADFEFQQEHAAAPRPVLAKNDRGVFFFTVVRDTVNYNLPEMAPFARSANVHGYLEGRHKAFRLCREAGPCCLRER